LFDTTPKDCYSSFTVDVSRPDEKGEAQMITNLIKTNEIQIVSGECDGGTIKIYNGKRTLTAIKACLTKERSHGDRWAKAKVFSHANDFGQIFIDLETGKYTF
jgi:carbamate kinase